MLRKEQWSEVGAMELDHEDGIESISIGALDVEQLLLEANERFKEQAMLDEKYRELCKQVSSQGNINQNFTIKDELICRKNGIYVPEGLRQGVIASEDSSKVAGHFGRERTFELVIRNFYWTNRECDIGKDCSECDI